MSEAINDMEAFTKLTDCVINAIAFHSVPNGELRQVYNRIAVIAN